MRDQFPVNLKRFAWSDVPAAASDFAGVDRQLNVAYRQVQPPGTITLAGLRDASWVDFARLAIPI